MTLNLKAPELRELKPRIMVCGIGGAGGNAVNNMIVSGLAGVGFIVANTDAQALASSQADRIIQMGLQVTEGLGAGSQPEIGRAAAEEAIEEIRDHLSGAHMVFVTAGMGGGTGTGAAPVIARTARDMGILTVGVVTKPFQFEGQRRMRVAEAGISELQDAVDTLIVIPNQNLFRVANEKTTFADAFSMADQVLYSGVACITDLMVKEGLINLDFADVRAVMREMGKAMMGTGEASGDRRAILAAEAAIANPLLDEVSMRGARGLLISITGGNDLTLYEVDEAASRIRQEVDDEANIILGATYDQSLEGIVRVSVVATGIDTPASMREMNAAENRIAEVAQRLRAQTSVRQADAPAHRPPMVGEAPLVAAGTNLPPAAQPPVSPPAPELAVVHDVVIQQMPPRQMPAAEAPAYETRMPPAETTRLPAYVDRGAFIPPVAEVPLAPRPMPTANDFPLVGQQQLRKQAAGPGADARKPSFLEKLAGFGVTRRDEPATAPAAPHAAPVPQRPVQASSAARPVAPSSVHSEYGRPQGGPRQAQLDAHGRTMPGRASEEDQLEIPAFLRRQSN